MYAGSDAKSRRSATRSDPWRLRSAAAAAAKFDLGQNSDMNVTPFVDVMLVLLIIFMVVAPSGDDLDPHRLAARDAA